jgi:hypothetical protein
VSVPPLVRWVLKDQRNELEGGCVLFTASFVYDAV